MPRAAITVDDLRRFAVARSLFPPTTLRRAIARMQFVQADPIRAPARAQDLILRHRVKNYRAGDLERNYVSLDIEEDTFINYGFVTREPQTLMHPRPDVRVPAEGMQAWSAAERKKAELLLVFLQSRGEVHPREVEEQRDSPRRSRSREGALTRALRSCRARQDALRTLVALDLPVRSLHAGKKTKAGLLRTAAPLARAGDRLG